MDEWQLLRRADGPVTRGRLAADLRALGLAPGDTVMTHTRLSALGYVAGGPQTLIAALLDAIGESGTLMAPCGWNDALPYDFTRWPRAWQEAVRAEHPAFDPALSEADHNNGRLPEALRHWPGAVRGRHPDAGFVAVGARAHELMDHQPWDHPHGADSPLARLTACDGRVLLLGAPLDTLTLLHHAEALADAPGKRHVTYEQPVTEDGRRVWRRFTDIDTEGEAFPYGNVVPPGRRPFEVIAEEMLAAGTGRRGRVAAAESHLFEAPAVVRFGVDWIERRIR
ncbi:aminoglycoside 3-N-acetyltransferase [Streptomyces sp. UNOB3_S3]|uniref:aminoglycoside 3-N-acetyltransferase n=1 Tax=Streptomyces sp. UNOB3_S3 TaxID=2871682 RepID=UPI001E3F0865|nr:aminoglycoside 3-N-acetyltransferase [Streptomyces sp. UNOB3_S3]MCC3773860.1 aminoglycoside 3-N-acetyltransferase [Streptomyces sp. UNOB3_S3]